MIGTFLFGALGYPALELITRGRTHYSMGIAGGLSMLLIRQVGRTQRSLPCRAVLCGMGITAIEYLCGHLWNRDYHVWDYRRLPLNWRGQVCLPYTLIWCGLSAGMLWAMDMLSLRRKRPGS